MSYNTDKTRVLRAIEKHGKLDNRSLSRACNVYGDNFKRAIKEIDEGNLDLEPEPLHASTLRMITAQARQKKQEQNKEKYAETTKYIMQIARENAQYGNEGLTYQNKNYSESDYENISEIFTELGFKTKYSSNYLEIWW